MMRSTTLGARFLAVAVALLISAALSACSLGASSTPAAEITPIGGQVSDAPGAPAATPAETPSLETTAEASGTGVANGAANITVAPGEVTLGSVVFSFSVQPAEPMYDPSRAPATPTNDQQNDNPPKPKGFAILGGLALKVTNNFDPSQSAPADEPSALVRHVTLQIKDKGSGQLIPDAEVTIDVLRDGRPVLQDQPLVPMVQAGGNVSQMHYGNNVKFPGPGEYQIFVRTKPSPLLGPKPLGVAQFNVSIN